MKKMYVFGIVSLLALSLVLAGCGGTSKSDSPADKQTTNQSQDMNNMNDSNGDMKNMDHSKMNMDDQKSENKQ